MGVRVYVATLAGARADTSGRTKTRAGAGTQPRRTCRYSKGARAHAALSHACACRRAAFALAHLRTRSCRIGACAYRVDRSRHVLRAIGWRARDTAHTAWRRDHFRNRVLQAHWRRRRNRVTKIRISAAGEVARVCMQLDCGPASAHAEFRECARAQRDTHALHDALRPMSRVGAVHCAWCASVSPVVSSHHRARAYTTQSRFDGRALAHRRAGGGTAEDSVTRAFKKSRDAHQFRLYMYSGAECPPATSL